MFFDFLLSSATFFCFPNSKKKLSFLYGITFITTFAVAFLSSFVITYARSRKFVLQLNFIQREN